MRCARGPRSSSIGTSWVSARAVAIVIAALAAIGNLSVVLYYDHTTTVTVNIVGLVLSLALLVLLLLPASKQYFHRPA
jgi:hypothetical protein